MAYHSCTTPPPPIPQFPEQFPEHCFYSSWAEISLLFKHNQVTNILMNILTLDASCFFSSCLFVAFQRGTGATIQMSEDKAEEVMLLALIKCVNSTSGVRGSSFTALRRARTCKMWIKEGVPVSSVLFLFFFYLTWHSNKKKTPINQTNKHSVLPRTPWDPPPTRLCNSNQGPFLYFCS